MAFAKLTDRMVRQVGIGEVYLRIMHEASGQGGGSAEPELPDLPDIPVTPVERPEGAALPAPKPTTREDAA